MGSEDFSEYGRAGVPATFLWIGATEPGRLQQAKAAGQPVPGLHSSGFAPDLGPTLRTATSALVLSAEELLGRP
jgi:hippurate hydrolase